jgi:beta-lactamase regulating signal transducer with metallopeptidase domain
MGLLSLFNTALSATNNSKALSKTLISANSIKAYSDPYAQHAANNTITEILLISFIKGYRFDKHSTLKI